MTQKAIDLEDFQELTTDEQARLLQRDGTYVGKREEDGRTAVLFQLHSFYVEIWYQEYRRHIDLIVSSKSTALLQPYLDQVPLRDLEGLLPGGHSSE
jgi:hypothetical protein